MLLYRSTMVELHYWSLELKPLLQYACFFICVREDNTNYLRWVHVKLIYDQQASTYLKKKMHNILSLLGLVIKTLYLIFM